MPDLYSYAPIIELTDYSMNDVQNVISVMRERELHAILIRRDRTSVIDFAKKLSVEFREKNILPLIQLYPGDDTVPLRNLIEQVLGGVVDLVWSDSEQEFDAGDLNDLLDGAGRYGFPLDLVLHFNGNLPELKKFKAIVRKVDVLADKYGHVQVVTLKNVPDVNKVPIEDSLEYFKILHTSCLRVKPSISPEIWLEHEAVKYAALDFGLVNIDTDRSVYDDYHSGSLDLLFSRLDREGMPITARLPLTPRLFRKGWYSFEIGKVLDYWVGRRVFHAYADRPGWLED